MPELIDDLTVAAWFSRWLQQSDIRPSTRATLKALIDKHITPHVGATLLADLTTARIHEVAHEIVHTPRDPGNPSQGNYSIKTALFAHQIMARALATATLNSGKGN